MPTLREVGEIEAIRRLTGDYRPGPSVRIGPGDDAALLRPEAGRELVVTTDAFVEGEHYRGELLDPETLGARLALANLSDLAAMAARPRWAIAAFGLRAEHDLDRLLELGRGFRRALAAAGAEWVGGNLSLVPDREWLCVTLLGDVPAGRAWSRGGAQAGDLVAVTGRPGRAAAGLALLERSGGSPPGWAGPLVQAWRAPEPRVSLALELAELGGVGAAIDLSDGFARDLARVCDASGVGVEVDLAAWPEDPLLGLAASELGRDPRDLALGPSDDYELLLAVIPSARAACEAAAPRHGVPLTVVGRFVADRAARVAIDRDGTRRPLPASGWDAFAGR